MIVNALKYFEKVKIGRFTFKIHQPTIPELDKMGFEMKKDDTKLGLMGLIDERPIKTLSYALTLRCPILRPLVYWYIKKTSWEEIKNAFLVLHGVVYGDKLIKSCNLDTVISKTISDIAGGKTLIGQIPTFCEYLHFTKEDVLTTPYPILLLMCADKQRVLSDDDIIKVKMTGKEFIKHGNA